MKISIITFDLWRFNEKIANRLTEQGHKVNYINTNDYKFKYPHIGYRIYNFLSKTFLRKNIKNELRVKVWNDLISKSCANSDRILIVNPGIFPDDLSMLCYKLTPHLMAYNYDSVARVGMPTNYEKIYKEVFSFDDGDIKKYGFKHAPNFNYISETPLITDDNLEHLAFTIQSIDYERMHILSKIADAFDLIGAYNYLFLIKDKPHRDVNKNIHFIDHYKSLNEVEKYTQNSKIIIDLIRVEQSGLSFRFYEAMAYQKKMITTNANVKNYDFYNPNNILVIDENHVEISKEFLESPYQPLPEEIYKKYTLDSWIKKVFNV